MRWSSGIVFIVWVASLQAQSISLPSDFPKYPVVFQEFSITDGLFQGMRFDGNKSITNGDIKNTGPVYTTSAGQFPYVMKDSKRRLLLIHPGTAGTVQSGASVSVGISRTTTYAIQGTFARANDLQGAGDGVRVFIVVNGNLAQPVFDAKIDSANAVDPDNPFTGPGTATFNLVMQLNEGDAVQFCVLGGSPPIDGTFDATALEFTVAANGR